ncbi:hypothetical protein SVAN01_09402 [Stagonosporopsis vannaccii]|nr:hypothetical protein SVAN01_09402 [Stagonosporopsis vannaccii]
METLLPLNTTRLLSSKVAGTGNHDLPRVPPNSPILAAEWDSSEKTLAACISAMLSMEILALSEKQEIFSLFEKQESTATAKENPDTKAGSMQSATLKMPSQRLSSLSEDFDDMEGYGSDSSDAETVIAIGACGVGPKPGAARNLARGGRLDSLQTPDLALRPRSGAHHETHAAHNPLPNVPLDDASSQSTTKNPSTGLVWRRHFDGKLRRERADARPPLVPDSEEPKYNGHRKQLFASGG